VDRIIAVRDLDLDHDADLLLQGESLSWISGAPQWKYQENPEQRPLTVGEPIHASSILLVDVDGNLEQELVLLQQGKLSIQKRAATTRHPVGIALFEGLVDLPADISSANYRTIAAADLDLNGTQELLLSTSKNTVVVQFQEGSASLATMTLPPAVTIVVGDIDGDGDPDLILEKDDGSLWLVRNSLDIDNKKLHAFRAHLGGRRDGDDRRTNLLGFGARLELRNPDQALLAFQEGSAGHRARGLQRPASVASSSSGLTGSCRQRSMFPSTIARKSRRCNASLLPVRSCSPLMASNGTSSAISWEAEDWDSGSVPTSTLRQNRPRWFASSQGLSSRSTVNCG